MSNKYSSSAEILRVLDDLSLAIAEEPFYTKSGYE